MKTDIFAETEFSLQCHCSAPMQILVTSTQVRHILITHITSTHLLHYISVTHHISVTDTCLSYISHLSYRHMSQLHTRVSVTHHISVTDKCLSYTHMSQLHITSQLQTNVSVTHLSYRHVSVTHLSYRHMYQLHITSQLQTHVSVTHHISVTDTCLSYTSQLHRCLGYKQACHIHTFKIIN